MTKQRVEEDEGGHLSFGSVVGLGIQEYFISGSRDKAAFLMFTSWKDSIDEDRGEKSNKTFWHALYALDKFIPFRHSVLSAYDVAIFDGKPAAELGFEISFDDGFRYRGKLDLLLIHRIKKEFLILEAKTTGQYASKINEASYKNSGQALGYGLIVDRIASDLNMANDYRVFYPVYATRDFTWVDFFFPKSDVQRASWLQSILLDIGRIQQYSEIDYFPIHGESCFSYNKQCNFYGICTMGNSVLGLNDASIRLDKEEDYPFKFTIQELIEAQLEKGKKNG
jgi:hypothetical protein